MNQAVSVNEVSTAKRAMNGAKNAGLYSVEKPLVGVSIVLRSAAAVLEFGSAAAMSGAKQLHTIRKDKESADAMVASVNRGFAAVEASIDAKSEALKARLDALSDKIAKAKAEKAAKAAEKAEEAAIQLLTQKGYKVK